MQLFNEASKEMRRRSIVDDQAAWEKFEKNIEAYCRALLEMLQTKFRRSTPWTKDIWVKLTLNLGGPLNPSRKQEAEDMALSHLRGMVDDADRLTVEVYIQPTATMAENQSVTITLSVTVK